MKLGKIKAVNVVNSAIDVTAELYSNLTKTARSVFPPGYSAKPLVDDVGFIVDINGSGKSAFVGVYPDSELDAGETKIYSRDSDGNIVASALLKSDGKILLVSDDTVNLGAESPSDAVALASVVNTNLTNIQNLLTALITKYNAHVHPTGVGPSGPTTSLETGTYSASDPASTKVLAE